MIHIETRAIVVGTRTHGEHGAIVRLMTADHGLIAGYVRGGRSRQLRPVLIAGNIVMAQLRARTDAQLASLTVELVETRSGQMREPLAAAAIDAEDFAAAMSALATLRTPIDAFFENVTVNDPDPAKRSSRLALLARFRDAVHRVADFSKIEG